MLFNLYTKGCSFLHSNMDPRRQNTRSHYVKEIQIMETLSFGRGLYMDNKNIRSCINIPTQNTGHKSTQYEWVISALATRLSIRFGDFWSFKSSSLRIAQLLTLVYDWMMVKSHRRFDSVRDEKHVEKLGVSSSTQPGVITWLANLTEWSC